MLKTKKVPQKVPILKKTTGLCPLGVICLDPGSGVQPAKMEIRRRKKVDLKTLNS